MDLRDKLKYYHPASLKQKPADVIDSSMKSLADELGGIVIGSAPFEIIKIFHSFPLHSIVYNLHSPDMNCFHIPLLSRGEFSCEMKPESLVFFDLETTGLAGGTGTYPFLLSFGFIEKCTIKVIQYFLPDFGREVSAFIDLNNYIENRSILVSYNGKSFDYPLLRNRFVLNRIRDPFHSFQHLDLLHFVRRLWKQRLKNCSLVNIEQEIFYFHRWQDIEAAFIPHVYFEFLRDGKTCNMKRVINHNLQDILTLVRLLFHIHFLENHIPETEEIQVLGRFAVENSDLDKLDLIFERMEKINLSPSQDLLVGYSLLLKRMGEWENAIRLWEELLNSGEKTVFACEELAKYYEHRKRDYIQAKNYTERALHYMDMLEEIDRLDEATVTRRSFQYRLERITHKQKSKSE